MDKLTRYFYKSNSTYDNRLHQIMYDLSFKQTEKQH